MFCDKQGYYNNKRKFQIIKMFSGIVRQFNRIKKYSFLMKQNAAVHIVLDTLLSRYSSTLRYGSEKFCIEFDYKSFQDYHERTLPAIEKD